MLFLCYSTHFIWVYVSGYVSRTGLLYENVRGLWGNVGLEDVIHRSSETQHCPGLLILEEFSFYSVPMSRNFGWNRLLCFFGPFCWWCYCLCSLKWLWGGCFFLFHVVLVPFFVCTAMAPCNKALTLGAPSSTWPRCLLRVQPWWDIWQSSLCPAWVVVMVNVYLDSYIKCK